MISSDGIYAATSSTKIKVAIMLARINASFHRDRSHVEHGMETVLNAILFPTIGLLTMLFSVILYDTIGLKNNYDYVHTIDFAFVIAGYVMLFVISKRGYVRIAAYGTVIICFLGSFYCGYRWGASLPETLLCFALTMGVTNMLFGMRTSLAVTALSFATLFFLCSREMYHPEVLSWQNGNLDITDFIAYFGIIALMFGLSWISRWKISRSLARAELSEKNLEEERSLLERRVTERTEELRQTQEKRISELASIAEFGRLSQGLFHDLISPISSMLLHIERLSALPSKKEAKEGMESLQKMCMTAKRFSGYLASLRLAISNPPSVSYCSFEEELEHIFNLLAFSARAYSVTYDKPEQKIGQVPFGPSDIHQVLFNLVANAVDSFEKIADERRKIVSVKAENDADCLLIEVSDNGAGISQDDLPHIYDQFFTTKKSCQGLGIGLYTVRRITADHNGMINVESTVSVGTRFKVVLPFPCKALAKEDGGDLSHTAA
ncbi:MAG: HAMP domain-containing sensor histidine kinase [Candidatus Pacebacteria bacterium]|nr:HAMP domain-containing sensor histidine kinase [Candidatus Paceibacterota bacterium]